MIIESIFSWPGMGRMAYEAILARDYPVILTVNFITAVLVLVGTLVSDLLYMVPGLDIDEGYEPWDPVVQMLNGEASMAIIWRSASVCCSAWSCCSPCWA